MKFFKVIVIFSVVLLLVGCTTLSPRHEVAISVPDRSAKEVRAERFKIKLARYLSMQVCPSAGSFDEYDLNQAKADIFESANIPAWIGEMNEVIQDMTQGRVNVSRGQTDDFLGLYAGKKISIRVFSHEKSRVYTIYEKRIDIYCDSPVMEFSSNFNPG